MADEGPASADARYEKAVLELLHATEAYLRREHPAQESPDEEIHPLPGRLDPIDRRLDEALKDVEKWRTVAAAATRWKTEGR
jgi:hypothetical protein